MWIFTKYGFFSAVCARQGEGEHFQPVDPDRIMIRARVREHLENMKQRFSDSIGSVNIVEGKGTDYAFRIFVPKQVWTKILAEIAEETDYDSFKSEVAAYQGKSGHVYEHSLHDVWAVMHELQQRRETKVPN